jgi:hypothetical protein
MADSSVHATSNATADSSVCAASNATADSSVRAHAASNAVADSSVCTSCLVSAHKSPLLWPGLFSTILEQIIIYYQPLPTPNGSLDKDTSRQNCGLVKLQQTAGTNH